MKIHNIHLRLLDALDAFTAYIHWFFSEERRNPYRCPVCGRTHIQVRAWVRPNRGDRYVGDCEDTDIDFCEPCRQKVHARTTDWFEREIDLWWSCQDYETRQQITGLTDAGFASTDDHDKAMNKHWAELPVEQKIPIWYRSVNH